MLSAFSALDQVSRSGIALPQEHYVPATPRGKEVSRSGIALPQELDEPP